MATRSTIAKLNPDNTVTSVYCHFDGYPEGVGATLQKHYTDSAKIDQLLALGDLSVLGDEIGSQVDFDRYMELGLTQCLFYGRDRAEDGVSAVVHVDADSWNTYRIGNGCEYGYLWNDTQWVTFKL